MSEVTSNRSTRAPAMINATLYAVFAGAARRLLASPRAQRQFDPAGGDAIHVDAENRPVSHEKGDSMDDRPTTQCQAAGATYVKEMMFGA